MDTEPSINIEITEKQSNLVGKLRKRLAQNKPADVIVLDMDGTVYGLQKNKNNEWEKTGQPHNAETSKIFREKSLLSTVASTLQTDDGMLARKSVHDNTSMEGGKTQHDKTH